MTPPRYGRRTPSGPAVERRRRRARQQSDAGGTPVIRHPTKNPGPAAGGGWHHGPMGSIELPLRLVIESDDEYGDVITSLALARFVTGAEPSAQELAIDGLGRAADL